MTIYLHPSPKTIIFTIFNLRQMEEAALQDYRDKDVHSSRDFTAKVGSPSFIHANPHLFQFETLSYSLQLYNGEKLPDTEGVVVKQGPQQNPFADSEFFCL